MQEYRNKILCGDCIELLGAIHEPFADLVFADPPFNVGFRYDKYHDKLEKNNYLAWTRDWMMACVQVLKTHGSLYVAIADDYAAHIRIIGEELGLSVRNWIIWHYTFGQQTTQKFAKSHTHILYFVKDVKNFVFNDYAIRVPSDRQMLYNDARADDRGKIPSDTWTCYSRVCGTFKEREGWHPCQMPELLLARVIMTSSNAGDLVLDPFSGSGTTAATAKLLGRDYCGIDISADYAANARLRLEQTETLKETENTGQIKEPKNAGLFDGIEIQNGAISQELSAREFFELKRLYVEMGIDTKVILGKPLLLDLFAEQFHLRMNNQKNYQIGLIQNALKELTTWIIRK
jgi:site-specific DNA-methyltransferase (adenine-specific)